jgi:beta-galactosidase
MAVERDRWIGAPLGVDGTPRAEADFYQRLVSAVRRTELYALERCSLVSIVIPRELMRLCRALHVFDPLSPTLLGAMTGDLLLGPSEQELGLPSSLVLDTLEFLQLLEQTLDAEHIAYSLLTADQLESAISSSRWTFVLSCGVMHDRHWRIISQAFEARKPVSIGPHFPSRDQHLEIKSALRRLPEAVETLPRLLGLNQPSIVQAVTTASKQLSLSKFAIQGDGLHASLFLGRDGKAKVAFLINPTQRAQPVSWHFDEPMKARDALALEPVTVSEGTVHLTIDRQSARMLELAPDS